MNVLTGHILRNSVIVFLFWDDFFVMLGIVIWTDEAQEKAVIWCEDHGELGYFNTKTMPCDTEMKLTRGNLIEFDCISVKDCRQVHHPKIISDRSFASLIQALGTGGRHDEYAEGKIVPFPKGPTMQEGKTKVS